MKRITPALPKELVSESYVEAKIRALRALYAKQAKAIAQRLEEADLTSFQRYRLAEILTQVNREVKVLSQKMPVLVKQFITASYQRGADSSLSTLRSVGITEALPGMGNLVNRSAVGVIADQTVMDLMRANGTVKSNVQRFLMQAQQTAIKDEAITRMVGEGLVQGATARQVRDTILTAMKKALGEEKFITINGKNYNLSDYAELVAVTRTREAVTQGAVNTCLQYGVDLMQVSVHTNSCERCLPYQGKVFSISGADTRFPVLSRKPPYHPRCKHVLLPVPAETLTEEQAAKLAAFSRSEDVVSSMNDYARLLAA